MERRRSRMRRQSIGKRIEVTARDIEIFRLLARFRFLRSTQLHAFVGGNRKRFVERLGHLYHEGYLDRPERQWEFADCRYMPVVYEIGRKAGRVLREQGQGLQGECVLTQGRSGITGQFSHQVMVAEILASIEIGTRNSRSVRFVGWPEILDRAPKAERAEGGPPKFPVSFNYRAPGVSTVRREKTSVIPDGMFGLEYIEDGKRSYRFFALETDRGTMPVIRRAAGKSSYLKKLLAYRQIAANQTFKSLLGLPNCLVLTVTTDTARVRNIMSALKSSTDGKGSPLFLFKAVDTPGDADAVRLGSSTLLTTPWERVGFPPLAIDRP